MSALNTDDPESAKRFYTEVFGWDTKSFDMGDAELDMWTVPGYVGGEPQQPVPRDVVATMLPPSADGEAPPHWSVDFWIADVDEAAERCRARRPGAGRALRRPQHRPEAGVFTDPQGAALSLTQPPAAS